MPTLKIYPSTTAHQFWLNGTFTQSTPYTVARCGHASGNYYWPVPFNVPTKLAEAGLTAGALIVKSLKIRAKCDVSQTNTFDANEKVRVGVNTVNDSMANAQPYNATTNPSGYTDLANAHTIAALEDEFYEWDVSGAWNKLKAGVAYLCFDSDEYAGFFTNHGNTPSGDRPYLELIYEQGTLGYRHADGVHRCQVIYRHSDGLHLVQPIYKAANGLRLIGL